MSVSGVGSMDAEAEVDGLYRLSLAEFTAARNALAVRLNKAGLGQAAARVKALAKPPAAAWAANQVYWNDRGAFDQLVDTAGRVREALVAGAPAEEARRAMRARHEALAVAVKKAEGALVDSGHAVSPAVLRRVQGNLEALAARTSSALAGRLTEDLDPPGLDVLAGLPVTDGPRPADSRGGAAETDPAVRARTEAASAARKREAEAAAATHAHTLRRVEGARAEAEEARRHAERAEARVREAEAAEAAARAAVEATDRALQDLQKQ